MPNHVDKKIDEITQAHVAECEKLNVSRNVSVTAQRVQEALKEFSPVEILDSGYWTGLHDQAKVAAIRDAVLELAEKAAKPAKISPVASEPAGVSGASAPVAENEAEPVAPKKPGRKPKVALA